MIFKRGDLIVEKRFYGSLGIVLKVKKASFTKELLDIYWIKHSECGDNLREVGIKYSLFEKATRKNVQ